MRKITIGEITDLINGELYAKRGTIRQVKKIEIDDLSTDSRTFALSAGESGSKNARRCFLALKGEKFDGNTFAEKACLDGAGAIITSLPESECKRITGNTGVPCIKTKDTLEALGLLGKHARDGFNGTVVAITGSVGKTSTKDITAKILGFKNNVLKTKANFNNEIGLPTTLLGLTEEHNMAVVEMGMRGLNQIRPLADFARPDIGIITNIGLCHIELLGSVENIMRAKLEIASNMIKNGTLLLNGDDKMLSDKAKVRAILDEYGVNPKIYYFGTSAICHFRAANVSKTAECSEFDIVFKKKENVRVVLNLAGKHNIINALAGAAAAFLTGMSKEDIRDAINSITPDDSSRQKIISLPGNIEIMDDAYNAGFESMKASLSVLKDRWIASGKKGRLAAAIGDMLELGNMSRHVHTEIGKYAAQEGYKVLITAGRLSKETMRAFKAAAKADAIALWAPSSEAASVLAVQNIKENDKILVKGSHSMHMEKVTSALVRTFGEGEIEK